MVLALAGLFVIAGESGPSRSSREVRAPVSKEAVLVEDEAAKAIRRQAEGLKTGRRIKVY